jgi:hypothetical protein
MVEMSTVMFAQQTRVPRPLSTTGVYAQTPERGNRIAIEHHRRF